MRSKLVITLTEEATKRYFELARQQTESFLNKDCEPEDMTLTISIAASNTYESTAYIMLEELGEVEVSIISQSPDTLI
jgi:hypothetical protein